jgi:hypothetical protein
MIMIERKIQNNILNVAAIKSALIVAVGAGRGGGCVLLN